MPYQTQRVLPKAVHPQKCVNNKLRPPHMFDHAAARALQERKEELDAQLAGERAALRGEEHRLHEAKTAVVTLEAKLSAKRSELSGADRARDEEALGVRRVQRARVAAELKEAEAAAAARRGAIARHRAETEAAQERLAELEGDLVRDMPSCCLRVRLRWLFARRVLLAAHRPTPSQ